MLHGAMPGSERVEVADLQDEGLDHNEASNSPTMYDGVWYRDSEDLGKPQCRTIARVWKYKF